MSILQEVTNEDQRFLMLLSLVHMSFEGNDSMIKDALYAYGHRISSSDIKEHLLWLEGMGLVELSKVGPYTKAKLTQKGQDVAEGRERVNGVRRPRAGEL
ncbi:ArsR family transcriptional regulator [Ignatzschineria rhizosphaerae]|uniref:ArsR family transcriptional regulator n=1 Tax=Ignatzschineria rhizosphaerae TaxID=2923279 RepID=A0ABY3X1B9_9GAMM|nr:ArsR family transcriptional regulator [Ignatzschineria rhizosphaerae]UNM95680.1 ArsR family transcriptional regulator [Ignatzschineria rhizosphaerae]